MKWQALVWGLICLFGLTPAMAQMKIGVSMALFDDNWLTTLRQEIRIAAEDRDVLLDLRDAQNQVGQQLEQIQDFIDSDVDAIIVNAVDTDATVSMSDDASAIDIPLVFVNRMPINVDMLPARQAFVASNEEQSGTLQTREVCRLLKGQGRVVVMMGELTNQAAIQRTRDVHNVLSTPPCRGLVIVDEQTAEWDRQRARRLMQNWLSAGTEFDAVIANNDEMAIGAIEAMKAHGLAMKDVVVAGIDATADALSAMQAGDLDVTVFQNARGQAVGALDLAIRLVRGEPTDQHLWVPFELVTPQLLPKFVDR